MVACSLFMHLLLFFVFITLPQLYSPKRILSPVYEVDLVTLPELGPVKDLSPPVAKAIPRPEPKAVPEAKVEPPPRAIPVKEEKKAEERKEEKHLGEALKSLRTEVKKDDKLKQGLDRAKESVAGERRLNEALGEIRNRISLRGKEAQAGVPGKAEEAGVKFAVYYGELWGLIRSQWTLSEGMLGKNRNLSATVVMIILKDGKLERFYFEKSSGNPYFDQSVSKAIGRANPFPPLPAWYPQNRLEVGVRFHAQDLTEGT
jgi:TonB family protein